MLPGNKWKISGFAAPNEKCTAIKFFCHGTNKQKKLRTAQQTHKIDCQSFSLGSKF
jgi:hypothetical protein